MSHYEGKTRVYLFNPSHPLTNEIEQLLKKAYTLLPSSEKKQYYLVKEENQTSTFQGENKIQVLFAFWEKLKKVSRLTFHAKTKSSEEKGWNGKGQGEVVLIKEGSNILIFNEKGVWQGKEGKEMGFSNVFRWTLDRNANVISLEHLRRGPDHPVFLFHLATSGKSTLSSVDSHLCEGDVYFGQMHFDLYNLCFNWRIIGPKKNEEINYYYS